MTRKEEIKQAAFNNDRESSKENQQYFIEGAEWADENPDEKMIAKYLKYKQDKFIEKAKLWLAEIHRVCDITDEHGYRIELRELRARLENYMKGE